MGGLRVAFAEGRLRIVFAVRGLLIVFAEGRLCIMFAVEGLLIAFARGRLRVASVASGVMGVVSIGSGVISQLGGMLGVWFFRLSSGSSTSLLPAPEVTICLLMVLLALTALRSSLGAAAEGGSW
jgi:hypothetical protein